MKQLLILSGKGGTGKTTVASSFIKLSGAGAYADCDIDAPNLHLVSSVGKDEKPSEKDYYGLPKASIDKSLCTGCGACMEKCRFGAIEETGGKYSVNPFACESCDVCRLVCPADAITLEPAKAGDLYLYRNPERIFSTAKLKMGSGTSGKLVTEVKKQLVRAAGNRGFAIIDGSPGIGCPVIASIAGADMVLIVSEPSVSGISDLERILKSAGTFGTKVAVCINKFDINRENTEKIEKYCEERNIPFLGRIPFDRKAVKAVNEGKTVTDIDCPSGRAVRKVYERAMNLFWDDGNLS